MFYVYIVQVSFLSKHHIFTKHQAMELFNLIRIEIYQDGKKWRWRVLHPRGGEIIGNSVEKFHKKEECRDNMKVIARLLLAFAVVDELKGSVTT
jgi:allantoicase